MSRLRWCQKSAASSGGGDYPAAAVSLGIESVYDLRLAGATGYQATPIKIPGVDSLPAGTSYDTTNHRVILSGAYAGSRRTFDGWDLKSVAAYLEITTAGWTVSNCLFGPSKDNTNTLNANNYGAKISNTSASATGGDANSNVIFEYNEFDGYDSGTDDYYCSALLGCTVKVNGVIIRFNYFRRSGQDSMNTRGDNIDIHDNYATMGGFIVGAHYDPIQHFDGDNLHVHENFLDMTPISGSQGRTNSVRLEAFENLKTIRDAVVENNWCPGAHLVDDTASQQFYMFDSVKGHVGATVSNNAFNNNGVSFATALVHPSQTGASASGNRKITDNSAVTWP